MKKGSNRTMEDGKNNIRILHYTRLKYVGSPLINFKEK
jgi:hypothetical protein